MPLNPDQKKQLHCELENILNSEQLTNSDYVEIDTVDCSVTCENYYTQIGYDYDGAPYKEIIPPPNRFKTCIIPSFRISPENIDYIADNIEKIMVNRIMARNLFVKVCNLADELCYLETPSQIIVDFENKRVYRKKYYNENDYIKNFIENDCDNHVYVIDDNTFITFKEYESGNGQIVVDEVAIYYFVIDCVESYSNLKLYLPNASEGYLYLKNYSKL